MISIRFAIISLLVFVSLAECGINWNGNNWALGCDFRGNDLFNVQISGDQCGDRCVHTPGCTHFTWTKWNGGTCWMKTGRALYSSAFETGDQSMVCGITDDTIGGTRYVDCVVGPNIRTKCPVKGRRRRK